MEKRMSYRNLERSAKKRRIAKNIVIYTLLTLWALMVLFPFYWMLITSVKAVSNKPLKAESSMIL